MGNRRLGKFEINNEFLFTETCEKIASLFKVMDFIPLRVECLGYKDVTEYVGISPLFEYCEEGSKPHFYTLVIVHNEDNTLIEKVEAFPVRK